MRKSRLSSRLRCARAPSESPRPALVLEGPEATVLGPLYARAADVASPAPLLGDPWARQLVGKVGDPSRARMASRRSVARTLVFDAVVRTVLSERPGATVTELGAGLNTRFERLDNGQVRWFDVDLPAITRLRRRVLPVCGRRMHLSASLLDTRWLDVVASTPGPYCFLFEAVLGYIPCPEVRPLFARLASRFPGATVAFDVHPRWSLDGAGALCKPASPPAFGFDLPRAIAGWGIGLELVDAIPIAELDPRDPPHSRWEAWRTGPLERPRVVALFRTSGRRPSIDSGCRLVAHKNG